MKLVLDTNIVVSSLLSTSGKPASAVDAALSAANQWCVDDRILWEYREVLHRERFSFESATITRFLDHVEAIATKVDVRPLPQPLPDVSDHPFLEVAISAAADHLVTGNLKHYRPDRRFGIAVVSPAEFLMMLDARGHLS